MGPGEWVWGLEVVWPRGMVGKGCRGSGAQEWVGEGGGGPGWVGFVVVGTQRSGWMGGYRVV